MTITQLKQDLVFSEQLLDRELTFHTTWGLFSPKSVDDGTKLLLEYMEVQPSDQVFDLGCGYGPLGLALATKAHQGNVHMVDKDFIAVDYAAKNAQLNGLTNVSTYLSNGFASVPPAQKFDVVVSNLPAKIGGELLNIFLHDAYDRLVPGGRLYVVTISGLRQYIKRHFLEVFGNYDKLKTSGTYTVAQARR